MKKCTHAAGSYCKQADVNEDVANTFLNNCMQMVTNLDRIISFRDYHSSSSAFKESRGNPS